MTSAPAEELERAEPRGVHLERAHVHALFERVASGPAQLAQHLVVHRRNEKAEPVATRPAASAAVVDPVALGGEAQPGALALDAATSA